jgi:hypothetical protein
MLAMKRASAMLKVISFNLYMLFNLSYLFIYLRLYYLVEVVITLYFIGILRDMKCREKS